MLETGLLYRTSTPMFRITPTSSSRTASGRRNEGIFVRISPPGLVLFLEERDLVAQRPQVVGHGQ